MFRSRQYFSSLLIVNIVVPNKEQLWLFFLFFLVLVYLDNTLLNSPRQVSNLHNMLVNLHAMDSVEVRHGVEIWTYSLGFPFGGNEVVFSCRLV